MRVFAVTVTFHQLTSHRFSSQPHGVYYLFTEADYSIKTGRVRKNLSTFFCTNIFVNFPDNCLFVIPYSFVLANSNLHSCVGPIYFVTTLVFHGRHCNVTLVYSLAADFMITGIVPERVLRTVFLTGLFTCEEYKLHGGTRVT